MAVDDRVDNLELVVRFIERMGYEAISVLDPSKVLETVQRTRPQVIVMDLALPGGKSGLDYTQQIKATIDPDVFVIAVTAVPDEYPKSTAFAAGCDAYLPKPFRSQALQTIIQQALDP